MSTDPSPVPQKVWEALPDIIGRLKNEFLLFTLGYFILVIAVGVFAPGVIDLLGRALFYLLVVLAFLAYVGLRVWDTWIKAGKKKADPPRNSDVTPRREDSRREESRREESRRDYLNALIADCNRLRLSGIDPTASDPTRARPMTLDQVYVGLDTLTMRRERDEDGKEARAAEILRPDSRETKPLSALEAISAVRPGRCVLLGLPGSGKSTLARYLALHLARALKLDNPREFDFAGHLPGWEGGPLLPVIVSLARLAQTIPATTPAGSASLILEHLRAGEQACYTRGAWVAGALRETDALVIFDGLDETPLEKRALVQGALRDFAATHPRCLCVVTCRTFSYTRDPQWQMGEDWPVFELAAFDQEKIGNFIHGWYQALTDIEPDRKTVYDAKAVSLRQALAPTDPRQLHELAGLPLLITLIAAVHTHEEELPGSRVLIYKKCVDLLLEKWVTERTAGAPAEPLLKALQLPDRTRLNRALWEVAFRAHESGPERPGSGALALAPLGLLEDAMKRWLGPERAATFIHYCDTANGLLMAQGELALPNTPPDAPKTAVYTFPHLTFEEYLAAQHLLTLADKDLVAQVVKLAADAQWREVILFVVECACVEGNEYRARAVLDKLCPKTLPRAQAEWYRAWLAGEGLPALRRVRAAGDEEDELDTRIVNRLSALLPQSDLPAVDRAAAGRTLAALGDPRKGVTTLEAMEFCYVPPGRFWMGGNEYDDEKPADWCNVLNETGYWMAWFPVTVAQWREYLTLSERKPEDEDSLRGAENHPVVYVTWYEARAFAEWLDAYAHQQKWLAAGWKVRLPSEAEWEKAARGGERMPAPENRLVRPLREGLGAAEMALIANPAPRREYPWEGDAEPERANYSDTGIGTTSAVGCFPGGVSPYGCEELAGNVWEWTRSLLGKDWQNPDFKYPYLIDERENLKAGRDILRVLRCGSFYDDRLSARCAYRFRLSPYYGSRYLGFRLVVSLCA